jgi:hypothetical protein
MMVFNEGYNSPAQPQKPSNNALAADHHNNKVYHSWDVSTNIHGTLDIMDTIIFARCVISESVLDS